VAVRFLTAYAGTCGLNLKILQAYDGQNALEIMADRKANSKSLDLVISDLDMPNKTGLDVLAEGLKLFSKAGYIIWSGLWSGNREWFMGLVTAGGATALDKPARMDKLFEAIAKYLPSAGKA